MCVLRGICREGGTPSSAAGRRRVPARRPPPPAPHHNSLSFLIEVDPQRCCLFSCQSDLLFSVPGTRVVRKLCVPPPTNFCYNVHVAMRVAGIYSAVVVVSSDSDESSPACPVSVPPTSGYRPPEDLVATSRPQQLRSLFSILMRGEKGRAGDDWEEGEKCCERSRLSVHAAHRRELGCQYTPRIASYAFLREG